MYYDAKKAFGKSHNRMTVDMGGEFRQTIHFRDGGDYVPGEKTTAGAGGGVIVEGTHDAVEISGVVTVSGEMYKELKKAYKKQGSFLSKSCTHSQYSSTDDCTSVYNFGNVTIQAMPTLTVEKIGSEVTMPITFSVNDLDDSNFEDEYMIRFRT